MPFIPANAIDGAITIAVLVIAFIGWLVQMAGQNKGPQPPANRPRPAGPPANRPEMRRDKSLQSEIDAFLREVGSTRKPPQKEEEAIEILDDVEVATARQPLASRREPIAANLPSATVADARTQPTSAPSEWDAEFQRRRERLVSTIAERHLASTQLGAEMRQHVDEYMQESNRLRREKEQIERSLADANAQIRAMRAQTSEPSGGGVRPAGRAAVAALLKDKRSVKDAIIVNEILAKPRALRSPARQRSPER